MELPMRPVTDAELPAFTRAVETAFGSHPSQEFIEWAKAITELDRTLAVFDGDRIVGSAGAFTFELTVPGSAQVPAAGVTAVGVHPTHRRRGILRAMIGRQLDDVAARGEPLAILTASESSIYGRFGYGIAAFAASVEIERSRAAFLAPVETPGRLRLVDVEEAGNLLPDCYDLLRKRTVGAVSRGVAVWGELLRERGGWGEEGAGKRFDVVHERAPGAVDGYVTYHVKGGWDAGVPRRVLSVRELYAADEQVRAALWQYALGVDLIDVIQAWAPVDDPLRWRLAEPRRLRTLDVTDHLWLRVLDVPAALAARRYGEEGRLVLDVADAFRPAAGGTFELRGGLDGAECRRVDAPADLRLGASELGSVYLGGVRFGALARAGRVEERTQGAAERADRMFTVNPAPWCSTDF